MKDDNTLIPTDETNITDIIYTIRGKQVMLDSDWPVYTGSRQVI